jgi:hypothetical protein
VRLPAAGLLATLALAAPAGADGFACEASALRLAGAEPVTAGGAPCTDTERRGRLPVAGEAVASTAAAPGGAVAAAGVAALRAGRPPALPLPALPDALGAVPTSLAGLDLGPDVVLDVRPAVRAARALADVALLEADAVSAVAGATCRDGALRLDGTASVRGLRVLGRPLPADRAGTHEVVLLPAVTLDLEALDLAAVPLPPALAAARERVEPRLRAALAALPDLALPAVAATVDVLPGGQDRGPGRLVQHGLRVRARVLGAEVLDAAVGRAAVAGACAEPPALRCTTRRLVLSDVVRREDRVRLRGAADPALAGELVELVRDGHDVVARAVVGTDGAFAAAAPLPPRADARYHARVGAQRSMALKLTRRMLVDRAAVEDGAVVVAGRITGPLAAPAAPVLVQQRVSCRRWRTIGRVTPGRGGRFVARAPAPSGADEVVVRLTTTVRRSTRSARTFPTATLPVVATR